MSRAHIEFSQEELEAICRRRAVKRLALFGSVLRDDFGPDSDVDVLIEFRDDFEGKRIYEIFDELSELFGGHTIDLVEVEFLNPRMKRALQRDAEELYAA
ncbi:MAG: nucleotidyltransferase domain-containing protein [Actinomycetes bacterium]